MQDNQDEWLDDVDRRVWMAFDIGIDHGFFRPGSTVVVATGWQGGSGHTNTIRIVTVPTRRPSAAADGGRRQMVGDRSPRVSVDTC